MKSLRYNLFGGFIIAEMVTIISAIVINQVVSMFIVMFSSAIAGSCLLTLGKFRKDRNEKHYRATYALAFTAIVINLLVLITLI